MMRRLWIALTLFGALPALLAGCSAKGTLRPDVPPETILFLQGPVDTVNHNVHLYWFGTDPDGYVTGYEIRFFNPSAPGDTCWTFTTKTDSLFSIYTPGGFAALVFEVRAIDNTGDPRPPGCYVHPDSVLHPGLRDPHPARQDFKFSNVPPTVAFLNRFRMTDTTYASATAEWTASDPDGDGTKLRFRVWLDGNEAGPNIVAGTSFTFPTDQFRQDRAFKSGPRMMFIQAVDDGGMASPVDSARWYVRAPATGGHGHPGRLLIIDDLPSTNTTFNYSTDTLYYNTAARNLGAGEYSILQLQYTQPFRSVRDLEQTFKLFDAVVWYIGGPNNFITFESTLQKYQDGIGLYLESGGNLYLDGQDLIDGPHASGPLRGDFVTSYLGSDFLFQWFSTNVVNDSTAGWGNANPSYFPTPWGDTLRVAQLSAQDPRVSQGPLRVFGIRDDAYGLLWAPPGANSITPAGVLSSSAPVAVSVQQPGGGRMILVSFPLRAAVPPAAPQFQRFQVVARFLARVFQQMGLAP